MTLTLYKYRSCRNDEEFGYLKDIIVNRNMWASCPAQLNDPYEWTPSFRTPTNQEVEEYKEEFIRSNEVKTTEKRLLEQALETFNIDDEREIWNSFIRKRGIVCLSEDKNNILMWSHYADSHKGVALEVSLNRDVFKVEYSSNRVECSFFCGKETSEKNEENTLTRKYECWEYEKEYRIIHQIKQESNYNKGELVQLPEGAIKKIILGARASKDLEEKLKKLVSDNNLDIPVKRAWLDEKKYRVNV